MPWLRDAPLAIFMGAGAPVLGDVVPRQLRFALTGSGPLETRTLVGETVPADRLLAGPHGPAARQRLPQLLAAASRGTSPDRGLPLNLTGFSLADSDVGLLANAIASKLLEPSQTALASEPLSPGATQQAIGRTVRTMGSTPGIAASYAARSGRIDFGSDMSAVVLDMIRGTQDPDRPGAGRAVVATVHELGHAQYPPPPDLPARLGPLEEFKAQLLAEHGDRMSATATTLGFQPDVWKGVEIAYAPGAHAVSRLLAAGDIDIEQAMRTANSTAGLPDAIANAIVAAQGIDPARVPEISDRIAATAGHNRQTDLLLRELGIPLATKLSSRYSSPPQARR